MNLKKICLSTLGMVFALSLFAQAGSDGTVLNLDEVMDEVSAAEDSIPPESVLARAAASLPGVAEAVADDMIQVQAGSFLMGSSDYENNEKPVHEVSVRAFSILRTEVTQAQYKAVTGENLSHFKGERRPVEEVSWYDAVLFCNKLSVLAGLTPAYSLMGTTDVSKWPAVARISDPDEAKALWNSVICDFEADGYRLPTEAEWEYAATGGPEHSDELYSGGSELSELGWNADYPDGETQEVGLKAPNSLGLYDMSGNVWEWCWDWYGNYHSSDSDNPLGADQSVTGRRMRRGGSISSDQVFCRAANRASSDPEIRGIDLGFRVVRTVAVEEYNPDSEPVGAAPEK